MDGWKIWEGKKVFIILKNKRTYTGKVISINEDKIAENLEPVRNNPSEAMTAILRGEAWIHSTYGEGHNFVKEMGKRAKKEEQPV